MCMNVLSSFTYSSPNWDKMSIDKIYIYSNQQEQATNTWIYLKIVLLNGKKKYELYVSTSMKFCKI